MGSLMEREPCPDRILGAVGGAFTMGAVGGSAFHFIKGLRNSPNGARIAGGLEAMRLNVPRVGGSFAVWGGLFSACDCALMYVRQEEDPWNSILSGAAVGGILSARQGFRSVVRSSLQGAVLLAFISGAGMMGQCSPQPNTVSMPVDDQVITPVETSSWWFSGLFGKRKVEEGVTNSSNKTDTFETYDVPSVPTLSFEYK